MQTLAERIEDAHAPAEVLQSQAAEDQPDEAGLERIESLEAELERSTPSARPRSSASSRRWRRGASPRPRAWPSSTPRSPPRGAALAEADGACETARTRAAPPRPRAEAARRDAARSAPSLPSANQFLRSHTGAPGGARALADELQVQAGLRARAGRRAGRADDGGDRRRPSPAARSCSSKAGRDGGRALVVDGAPAPAPADTSPPAAGARRLADLVSGPEPALGARPPPAGRRLAGRRTSTRCPPASPASRSPPTVGPGSARPRELRQAARGGSERVLAERNRRDALIAASPRRRSRSRARRAARRSRPPVRRCRRGRRDPRGAPTAPHARPSARATRPPRRAARPSCCMRAAPAGARGRGDRRAPRAGRGRAGGRAAGRRACRAGARGARAADRLPDREARARRRAGAGGASAWRRRWRRRWRRSAAGRRRRGRASRRPGGGRGRRRWSCAPVPRRRPASSSELRERGEAVTSAEVRAQQARDQEAEAAHELAPRREARAARRAGAEEPLDDEAVADCVSASSGWSSAVSSSARSTRWPRRSTTRRSPTSRRWSASAATSRRRCAS